jgi:predicted HTH transcriptional regulator
MTILVLIIIILIIVVAYLSVALKQAHVEDVEIKRQINSERIMSLFASDKELTNTEIRKALGVSSRTAVRYMDELEREGKVVQVGKIGNHVTYQRK